jgi:oligopeptide/dipeptide ABC transporter ATP-binding protein
MTGPKMDKAAPAALVEVDNVSVEYQLRSTAWFGRARALRAVNSVSLSIATGQTLGLVGESGSGKSTLGRAIIRLQPIAEGTVRLGGLRVDNLTGAKLRAARRRMQIVFQDPYSSLNRHLTVAELIERPLRIAGDLSAAARSARVRQLLDLVRLGDMYSSRYPVELSGGQRQRVGIARALATGPEFIVCDEPISALDVSIQAQITELLRDLQRDLGVSYLFIAHDLAAVQDVSHRVMVMYLGAIVETADARDLFSGALHPYTQALISAAPIPDPRLQRTRDRIVLSGEQPSHLDVLQGCVFATRCPYARDRCRTEAPALEVVSPGRSVACHYWRDLTITEGIAPPPAMKGIVP